MVCLLSILITFVLSFVATLLGNMIDRQLFRRK